MATPSRRNLPRIDDLYWYLLGSVGCWFAGWYGTTGTLAPASLSGQPFLYGVDAIWHEVVIKQSLTGAPFTSARFGYPFGANWNDWPSLDWGIIATTRVMGLFTSDYVLATNLLFLAGFPLAFITAFAVTRRLGMARMSSAVVGVTFALAPYHFERMLLHGHLFLTWYFTAPVYVLLAWRLVEPSSPASTRSRRALRLAGIALLTAFNMYYVAFGLIVIAAGCLYALTERPARDVVRTALPVVSAQVIGIAVQFSPTILYSLSAGRDAVALVRPAMDSYYLGFTPLQLLLPHLTHRLSSLTTVTAQLQSVDQVRNENIMASLGVVAGAGFLALCSTILLALVGRAVDRRIKFFGLLLTTLFAFGVKGGAGFALALLDFTYIRSWNRTSIFIAFIALSTLLMLVEKYAARIPAHRARFALPLALVVAACIVWVDQTPRPCPACTHRLASNRNEVRGFVSELEAKLPKGAAIYELPYVAFPGGQPVMTYESYNFMKPFLESSMLRFNLGSMQTRPGDNFFKQLSTASMTRQIGAARALGFSGMYVDRSGYADHGDEIIAELDAMLGANSASWSRDHDFVYFDLHNARPAVTGPPLTIARARRLTGFGS